MFPSGWAGGWGREELMVVNSKTVAVLHVGGGVPGQGWSGGWAGWRSLGTVNVNVLCDLSLLQTLISSILYIPLFKEEGSIEPCLLDSVRAQGF